MAKDLFNEKIAFAVALFAALIAAKVYLTSFQTLELNLGIFATNLLTVFHWMLITLFISVYFYALDYAKYGFEFLQTSVFFKYSSYIGNFFYMATLLILPLAFLVHFINFLVFLAVDIITFPPTQFSMVSGIIVGILGVIVGMISAWSTSRRLSKLQKRGIVFDFLTTEQKSLQQAEEMFRHGFYTGAIIEMFKSIELALKKRIYENTEINAKTFGFHRLLQFALQKKILTSEQVEELNEIREIRNRAAHLAIELTKEDAERALGITNKILEEIDPKSKWDT